jgi:hypothetical protein
MLMKSPVLRLYPPVLVDDVVLLLVVGNVEVMVLIPIHFDPSFLNQSKIRPGNLRPRNDCAPNAQSPPDPIGSLNHPIIK